MPLQCTWTWSVTTFSVPVKLTGVKCFGHSSCWPFISSKIFQVVEICARWPHETQDHEIRFFLLNLWTFHNYLRCPAALDYPTPYHVRDCHPFHTFYGTSIVWILHRGAVQMSSLLFQTKALLKYSVTTLKVFRMHYKTSAVSWARGPEKPSTEAVGEPSWIPHFKDFKERGKKRERVRREREKERDAKMYLLRQPWLLLQENPFDSQATPFFFSNFKNQNTFAAALSHSLWNVFLYFETALRVVTLSEYYILGCFDSLGSSVTASVS